MSNKPNIITTKILTIALALAPAVFAHGGFDHVTGTVAQVSSNVLTVKTAKGNVDVKLDDKTEISKGDQKALTTDLKPGLRVIVDIPEGSKDNIAHSVKIGATGSAAHADHDAH
jgi:Domain of unknown function (DUF5666)